MRKCGCPWMFDLLHKDYKVVIIRMFKELKEIIFKEVKESLE